MERLGRSKSVDKKEKTKTKRNMTQRRSEREEQLEGDGKGREEAALGEDGSRKVGAWVSGQQ